MKRLLAAIFLFASLAAAPAAESGRFRVPPILEAS